MKNYFSFLFIFLITTISFSQDFTNTFSKTSTFNDSLKISNIYQDETGFLWLFNKKNAYRFDGESLSKINTKLNNKNITSAFITNDTLLLGTKDGVYLIDYNNEILLESKSVNTIQKIKNKIFVGTKKGIYVLKEDYLLPLKTKYEIDLKSIKSIVYSNKNYWILTDFALWKIDDILYPKNIQKVVSGSFSQTFSTDNKLYIYNKTGIFEVKNNKVNQVYETNSIDEIHKIRNEFWITSDDGIVVLDNNFNFSRNINKYNSNLITNTIQKAYLDNENTIWLATNKGLYKDTSQRQKNIKPHIVFESIEIDYQKLDSINPNKFNGVLKLPSFKNNLSFNFISPSISAANDVLYQYSLNNKSSDWSNKRNLTFANLSPGNYNLSVIAKTKNQISKPVSFSFNIDKPLLQKRWFQVLIVALLLSITSIILFFYVKSIRKKNKEKVEKLLLQNRLITLEQKALQLQMNPHFIFNVLNDIKASGKEGKIDKLENTIQKFASLLRSVLQNSQQEDITLETEIEILKNYLELEKGISTNNFSYTISSDVNDLEDEVLLPPMLFQPLVENAIKHGIKSKEGGKIMITFHKTDNYLICKIQDNGVGYKHSKSKNKLEHNSVALNITKERIKNLSIYSDLIIKEIVKNNEVLGTEVTVKIPFKTDF